MNAFAERLNGTIKREAFAYFLLISEKQVRNIVSEFVEDYNIQRMSQEIDKIPDAETQEKSGVIRKKQILGGLFHHCYRSSA